jgi:hypothetical protein
MKDYDFTLKFNLQDIQIDPDVCVERLYAGGCDDALIGVGLKGFISLNFTREASSAYEAIYSAINDVKTAIPSATLIEATPDFVGLTDVAKIVGCSRQNMRNLIVNSDGQSPLPVYGGTPSIWHLGEILRWLRAVKMYSIDDSLLEVTETTMNINIVRSYQKIEPGLQENIKSVVF